MGDGYNEVEPNDEEILAARKRTESMDRLPASDRVKLATRTEAPVTAEMLARFQNPKAIRLLHAALGLATETAGEMLDMLKKHFFYGKPLDELNFMEEMGDADWYLNLACDTLHTTMAVIEVANIKKLAKRYGEKFSEDAALLRNLGAELEVLKENLPGKVSDPDFIPPTDQFIRQRFEKRNLRGTPEFGRANQAYEKGDTNDPS